MYICSEKGLNKRNIWILLLGGGEGGKGPNVILKIHLTCSFYAIIPLNYTKVWMSHNILC